MRILLVWFCLISTIMGGVLYQQSVSKIGNVSVSGENKPNDGDGEDKKIIPAAPKKGSDV
jgi:stress response protein SCP2